MADLDAIRYEVARADVMANTAQQARLATPRDRTRIPPAIPGSSLGSAAFPGAVVSRASRSSSIARGGFDTLGPQPRATRTSKPARIARQAAATAITAQLCSLGVRSVGCDTSRAQGGSRSSASGRCHCLRMLGRARPMIEGLPSTVSGSFPGSSARGSCRRGPRRTR